MFEPGPRTHESSQRHTSRRLMAGLASIALLPAAAGGIATSPANAAPNQPSKSEISSTKPSARSHESIINSEQSSFIKLMNARTRQSAIRFGKTPNIGPMKPGTVYESFVGVNRLLIRNFGTPPGPYGDKGYSITTVAPERHNGSTVFSKLISTEMRAGNQRIGFMKDFISGDWIVDWEVSKRNGETKRVVAAADIDIALMNAYGDDIAVTLSPERLAAANQTAADIQQDILSAKPVEKYNNPLS